MVGRVNLDGEQGVALVEGFFTDGGNIGRDVEGGE